MCSALRALEACTEYVATACVSCCRAVVLSCCCVAGGVALFRVLSWCAVCVCVSVRVHD